MNPSSSRPNNKGPKACTTCARAKARCITGPEGSLKCERCHRLKKSCVSQTPAPPRVRKSPKLSKIAALEKRLEELSSQVQDGPTKSASSSPKVEAPSESCDGGERWNFSHLFPVKQSTTEPKDPAPMPTPPMDKSQPWDSWWPTHQEADLLLATYRNSFARLFPFALVPENARSVELRQRQPFLWKAIMMVVCFSDGARQVKLGKELLSEIGQAAVVDGTKSLDLLHGVQMIVAWFHYALKGSQVTNLLFLARAMCVHLSFKDDPTLQGAERDQNLSHMRAYSGTYYLNTLVFTANKKPDALMSAEILETCCRVLESTMQYPSDEYLVKLVKIQQLAQSISLTMSIGNISQYAMKLPLPMLVQSFQDQLDQFRNSLSPFIAKDDALKCHINIAEALLYEIAISDQHTNASYVPLTDRLQLLWGCVRSLRSFYEVRFDRRDFEHPRFLCLSASDFAFAVITGLKLLTLQLPGWNLPQIQNELKMIEVLESQIRDLIVMINRRKQGLFPGAGVTTPTFEDPFERLLRQLYALRDVVKLELNRQTIGSSNVQEADFNLSLLPEDSEGEIWQGVAAMEVWNVIGDPTVLDAGMPSLL